MRSIQVGNPGMNELFQTDKCSIGNGAVVIDLRTCNVTLNPALTIDNAAKLAAKSIYEVMQWDDKVTSEPEWLNAVTFASEDMIDTPAVRIVDNNLYINSPPFLNSKKNMSFWRKFTDYWYIMVVKAMDRALFARKDKTFHEEKIIDTFASKDV